MFSWHFIRVGYLPHGVGSRTHCVGTLSCVYRTQAPKKNTAQLKTRRTDISTLLNTHRNHMPWIMGWLGSIDKVLGGRGVGVTCVEFRWIETPWPPNICCSTVTWSSSYVFFTYHGYLWISFLNMIAYWWNLNQRHGVLDMQVSTMQSFGDLTHAPAWPGGNRIFHGLGAWNLFFLGWDPWCGLKNRVPHVIDHGWWFVQWWLGAWVFAPGSSESRAQETQRPPWQLKPRRSGWAAVSDGPRSPAMIHW